MFTLITAALLACAPITTDTAGAIADTGYNPNYELENRVDSTVEYRGPGRYTGRITPSGFQSVVVTTRWPLSGDEAKSGVYSGEGRGVVDQDYPYRSDDCFMVDVVQVSAGADGYARTVEFLIVDADGHSTLQVFEDEGYPETGTLHEDVCPLYFWEEGN